VEHAVEIDLRELPEGASELGLELTGASLALAASDAELEGPLHVHLRLDRRADEIWIRGKASGRARQECSRCLAEYGQNLDLEFDVFCAKVQNPNVVSHKAVDEDDGGIHVHDGRVLSIDGEIREAVILGLPMKPLCREACAGLCPRCGEDLNQGPCRCATEAAGK
jgi:uncharacterized protein